MRDFSLGLVPFTYADLYEPERLASLAQAFDAELTSTTPALGERLRAYRAGTKLAPAVESELLLAVAQPLGQFVARLFGVEAATEALRLASERDQVVFAFRHEVIGRRVRRRVDAAPPTAAALATYARLEARLGGVGDPELRAARTALAVLGNCHTLTCRPPAAAPDLTAAKRWLEDCLGEPAVDPAAVSTDLLHLVEEYHAARLAQRPPIAWPSYWAPATIDPQRQALVPHVRPNADLPEALAGLPAAQRRREGFALTDRRASRRQVQSEVNYCLICHVRAKDSCRHGLRARDGSSKQDALGNRLDGCPLDERVSEAHLLRRQGHAIAALAMICLDNPMCPGTGHRICNDCMKGCIFQKQEPVNIPQVETGILTDVLNLPYGFEIYSLLSRWNPLARRRCAPRPYRGLNVLVTGLGPAGYTLAHYLLGEGFGVVGIDAVKLEPLPAAWLGEDVWPPVAIRDYQTLETDLATRRVDGFGGVAEYGITVRWDKNFLRVLYLNLARQKHFQAFGGIRLGGTLTLQEAWTLGFHHVALAAGAGRPTLVPMENNLLPGMRAASDFLMGLQLSGAFRNDALANLQVELPALVIGGGLTAIDTATELAAYYPVQVERLLVRVETLGEATVREPLGPQEAAALDRMLTHARILRAERLRPQPNIPALVLSWGGVAVVYRRSLQASPAYRLNHEEVHSALAEGIGFIEHLTPVRACSDAFGHVEALQCRRADGQTRQLPARTVIMAAGTAPNVIYEREYPGTFALDAQARFFAAHELDLTGAAPRPQPAAAGATGFFTSYCSSGPDGRPRLVSYYGDNHPVYAGNVVRAMASAKDGHVEVARLLAAPGGPAAEPDSWLPLLARLRDSWQAHVVRVERLGPNIIEMVVRAPAAARRFEPGQFYRLQAFEGDSPQSGGQALTMEGLAMTGAWVDREAGLLGMVALEMGTSSRLCALLQAGQAVVLMGPTGAPTELPERTTVLLCGGGLGNAVLLSVGNALRRRGNRVLYFAGYRRDVDVFRQEAVEACCDQVIWSVAEGTPVTPSRPQDRSFSGTILAALEAYGAGALGSGGIPLATASHILVIGSDRMMQAISAARHASLRPFLHADHVAVASINSPMQCMMKEVCAQCLQRQIDPVTGAVSYVFSCFNQDQEQDKVDWGHLSARLRQNALHERVSDLYLTHLLKTCAAPRI